jgi:hypothetical protein
MPRAGSEGRGLVLWRRPAVHPHPRLPSSSQGHIQYLGSRCDDVTISPARSMHCVWVFSVAGAGRGGAGRGGAGRGGAGRGGAGRGGAGRGGAAGGQAWLAAWTCCSARTASYPSELSPGNLGSAAGEAPTPEWPQARWRPRRSTEARGAAIEAAMYPREVLRSRPLSACHPVSFVGCAESAAPPEAPQPTTLRTRPKLTQGCIAVHQSSWFTQNTPAAQ